MRHSPGWPALLVVGCLVLAACAPSAAGARSGPATVEMASGPAPGASSGLVAEMFSGPASAEAPSGPTAAGTPSGSAAAAFDRPGVPASSVAEAGSRLDVVLQGQVVHIRNGGRVFLGDGLVVEIFLDPYPPTDLRVWMDVYLTRGPQAEPVADAQAMVDYDMRYMYHGASRAEGRNLGDGHYLFELNYLMFGAWDQLVTLRTAERRYELPVVVVAYP